MALPELLERSYSDGAVATVLTNQITDTDATITCQDASTFPLAGGGKWAAAMIARGKNNEELIFYQPRNGNVLQNCIRGGDSTRAFTHQPGESVEHVNTALDAREANALVADANTWTPYTPSTFIVDGGPTAVFQSVEASYLVIGKICFIRGTGLVATTGAAGSLYGITTPPGLTPIAFGSGSATVQNNEGGIQIGPAGLYMLRSDHAVLANNTFADRWSGFYPIA